MSWLANRREKRARQKYDTALAAWQDDTDALQHLIQVTQWPGDADGDGMVLQKGEARLFSYRNSSLIEFRRGQGHYVGGYSGFSFKIAKGVRYHVGGTRGRYVPGEDAATAIDTGTVYFTTRRILFLGPRQTREWAFAKLVGVQHDDRVPRTFLQVSNRQKTSGFNYSAQHAALIKFYVALALAHFQGHVAELTASLQAELAEHAAQRPELALPASTDEPGVAEPQAPPPSPSEGRPSAAPPGCPPPTAEGWPPPGGGGWPAPASGPPSEPPSSAEASTSE